jgi:ubiquitin C-terminal hydrolase
MSRVGLINTGNDCYINSLLQCLAVSPFIIKLFKKYEEDDIKMIEVVNKYELGKYKSNDIGERAKEIIEENSNSNSNSNSNLDNNELKILNKINKNAGDIFIYIAIREMIKKLNNSNKDGINLISNKTFVVIAKEILESKDITHLLDGNQNDPHELMVLILDSLHDSKSNNVDISINENDDKILNIQKQYLQYFKKTYETKFSYLVKNPFFTVINCVACNSCNHHSNTFSPYNSLCLAMPGKINENITINDCLGQMFNIEDISYKCEKCENKDGNKMVRRIFSKPKTLMIILKKYVNVGTRLMKINKMIQYSEILDIKEYYCGSDDAKYELYGIVNHSGLSINSGHYYSFVREPQNNIQNIDEKIIYGDEWYLCNDANIGIISKEEVMKSNNAYILFYQAI